MKFSEIIQEIAVNPRDEQGKEGTDIPRPSFWAEREPETEIPKSRMSLNPFSPLKGKDGRSAYAKLPSPWTGAFQQTTQSDKPTGEKLPDSNQWFDYYLRRYSDPKYVSIFAHGANLEKQLGSISGSSNSYYGAQRPLREDSYYEIGRLDFKAEQEETYYDTFPSIKSPDVFQVGSVAVAPAFRGRQIGLGAYKAMMDANFVLCSDQLQTDDGRKVWEKLIQLCSKTADGEQVSVNNPGPYKIIVLSPRGFVWRDTKEIPQRPWDDPSKTPHRAGEPKPVTVGKNKQDKDYQSVPHETIWIPDKSTEARGILLFAGRSELIDNLKNKHDIPSIDYTDYRQWLAGRKPNIPYSSRRKKQK